MITVNQDLSIYATRGDAAILNVTADNNGVPFVFQPGDVVRMRVFEKKGCHCVLMLKDVVVSEATDKVDMSLTKEETKIGELISKPKDYWYEIELNPDTNPQTIVGYDDNGPKVFRLFPEGADVDIDDPPDVYVPAVDEELDATSTRPVQNQAIANAIEGLSGRIAVIEAGGGGSIDTSEFVKNTDYATATTAGLVKSSATYGLYIGGQGLLTIKGAGVNDIDTKKSGYMPITPSGIDHAVKVGLTTNTETLTDEEKAAAQAWLGIDLGDMETALDSIIAIQESLVGVELIDFTVNGMVYQAEEGMTWEEFVNSDYNPVTNTMSDGKAFKNGGTNVAYFGMSNSPNGFVAYEGVFVTTSDTIIANRVYVMG